jgi:hypothetical protein
MDDFSTPNARDLAIQQAMATAFPVLAAKVERLEAITARLMQVNLQLAARVRDLEGALDEAPAVAVDLGGRPALGRVTGGALSIAQR